MTDLDSVQQSPLRGDAKKALKELERLRKTAMKAKRVDDLEEYLLVARRLETSSEGSRLQGEARFVVYGIEQNLRQLRRQMGLPPTPRELQGDEVAVQAATVSRGEDVIERLAQLAELRDRGLITEEEFLKVKAIRRL